MPRGSFSIDVAAIRDRARQKMDRRPVTDGPTSRRLMEKIQAEEKEHADGLVDLLGT